MNNILDSIEQDVTLEPEGVLIPIGEKEILRASEILNEYKRGKANLENRIVEDEKWWKLRHWDLMHVKGDQRTEERDGKIVRRPGPEPSSGWLFNAISNKHADAMDNYPAPVVLPRERSDEESAKVLSSVLPVILQYNDFEQVYSDNWWDKLKHGTALYGVFWNPEKENGLGDIDIKPIDLLKIFWEPGITDIQKSRHLFLVDLVDHDLLQLQYPELKKEIKGSPIDVKQYIYDDMVDLSNKDLVVDWYYKVRSASGKTLLHYVKFCGNTLLYASENDPQYRERGFYDHGLYPVVFDVMYPEKGTPVGFGYVAICKDPQMYIDKLSANILESSMMGTKKRYFKSTGININTEQFMNWNEPIVEVEGSIDPSRLMEINVNPPDSIYLNIINQKIEEMKDTASNRDVNSGGAVGSVTAASAIAALQEAGNKTSRDMIASSYRAQSEIASLCVELIRQFYDEARSFRIIAPNGMGDYDFAMLSNAAIKDQQVGMAPDGSMLYRHPVFDLKISAQRKNPFSRMEQNERAKELYGLGFFSPERAQEALQALDMMDFEGIEKIREKVNEGQTLLNIVQQQQMQIQQLMWMISGRPVPSDLAPGMVQGGAPATDQANVQPQPQGGSNSVASGIMDSQMPRTSYMNRLAQRSKPDMNTRPTAATPV